MYNELNELLEWLQQLQPWTIYIFLVFSSFVENVFPPWPGDTMIVISGFLAAEKNENVTIYFLFLLLGNLLGATTMYFAGTWFMEYLRNLQTKTSYSWLQRTIGSLLNAEQFAKTKLWFEKWKIVCIIASRFFAGIRFFVSIVAGMTQMNFLLFLLYFTLGVLLWNSLLLWCGWQLGENWEIIIQWLEIYNKLFLALVLVMLVGWLVWKFLISPKLASH